MPIEPDQLWVQFIPGFLDFAQSFKDAEGHLSDKLVLKIKHSFRTVDEITDLTSSMGWSPYEIELAQTVALLHDIGRFAQYGRYHTFQDQESEDHGDLSCAILESLGELDSLGTDKWRILTAIRLHNKLTIPPLSSGQKGLALAIRDADKLDIFRVLLREVAWLGSGENFLGLDRESKIISPDVSKQYFSEGKVSYPKVKTVGDLNLMILSWIYDLNYDYSLRRMIEEGYLNSVIKRLQESSTDCEIEIEKARIFIKHKLGKNIL